jgi:orotidine-5'-phosphate decarboxylase
MRAAVHGRGGSDLKLLAVTVLTSFDQNDLREFGYACTVQELTGVVVAKALETGVDGVIASPLDAAAVRAQAGPDLLIVTPGVRSRGSAVGDQKRVATPAEAIRDGADYLVIGRQVTRSADPRAAIAAIREEVGMALHAEP